MLRSGTGYSRGFDPSHSKSLSQNTISGVGDIRDLGVVMRVRREPKLNRTERTEAKWTQPTRQQEIVIKSESNTKSCVRPVNYGDNDG